MSQNINQELQKNYDRWRKAINPLVQSGAQEVVGRYGILMFKEQDKSFEHYLIEPEACIQTMYGDWGCVLPEGKTASDMQTMLEGQLFTCRELGAVRCVFAYLTDGGNVVRLEHARPA